MLVFGLALHPIWSPSPRTCLPCGGRPYFQFQTFKAIAFSIQGHPRCDFLDECGLLLMIMLSFKCFCVISKSSYIRMGFVLDYCLSQACTSPFIQATSLFTPSFSLSVPAFLAFMFRQHKMKSPLLHPMLRCVCQVLIYMVLLVLSLDQLESADLASSFFIKPMREYHLCLPLARERLFSLPSL